MKLPNSNVTAVPSRVGVRPIVEPTPKLKPKLARIDPGQTRAPHAPQISPRSGVLPKNGVLASLAARNAAPTVTELAHAKLKELAGQVETLGPTRSKEARELYFVAQALKESPAPREKLEEALQKLSTLLPGGIPGRFLDPVLPGALNLRLGEVFLTLFVEYLDASHGALEEALADVGPTPDRQAALSLRKLQRLAIGAASEHGDAFTISCSESAGRLGAGHPGLSAEAVRAQVALAELAHRADQRLLDLLGVSSGPLSPSERAELLAIDGPAADRSLLEARLDVVEDMCARGAPLFADKLLREVARLIPAVELYNSLSQFRKWTVDEAFVAKHRAAHEPALSIADAKTLQQRIDTLRPTVEAAALGQEVQQLRALFERGWGSPEELERSAGSLLGWHTQQAEKRKDYPVDPEHLEAARDLFVDMLVARLDAQSARFSSAIATLDRGVVLEGSALQALNEALVGYPPHIPDYGVLDADRRKAVDAARDGIKDKRDAVKQKLVNALAPTRAAVKAEQAALRDLPEAQRSAKAGEFRARFGGLYGLWDLLPDADREAVSALLNSYF